MRNIKQLRAISYAYALKKEKEARQLMDKCSKLGIKVKQSAYAQITIKHCQKALELIKEGK